MPKPLRTTCPPAPGFASRMGRIVDERRDVQFQELHSVELMNRLTGSEMPFDWTVNPYRGCEVGCSYCYARPTHEYLGHPEPGDFEERIYVKRADPARLIAALRRARTAGQEVAIGTATDPYQPAEGRFSITRGVLEALIQVPGLRVSLTTKCASITRDLPLLERVAAGSSLIVNVSLISLDRDLLRLLEPKAPRPDLRLGAMRALTAAGVRARLFVMPVLPLLTDAEAAVRDLLHAAADAGAVQAIWNVLFLRGSTRPFFLEFLRREMPWLVPKYRVLYASGSSASAEYRTAIDALMRRLTEETGLAGLTREERIRAERPAVPRQLALL
jgi:DNA repair photolyase